MIRLRMVNTLLIERLRAEQPRLADRGVAHLAIFGSRARGEERPDSDLDVLLDVPFEKKFSLIDLVAVERMIGEATGLPAAAVMRRSANPDFLARIASDLVEIY